MVNVNTVALRKLGKFVGMAFLAASVTACANTTAKPPSIKISGAVYQTANPAMQMEVVATREVTTDEGIEQERCLGSQTLYHTDKPDGSKHSDVGANSKTCDDSFAEAVLEATIPGVATTATGAILNPLGAALGQRLAGSAKKCTGPGCNGQPVAPQPPVVLNNYNTAIADQQQDQAAHLNSAVNTGGACMAGMAGCGNMD